MSEFKCDHSTDEECPHFNAAEDLGIKLKVIKMTECERCAEAHELLDEYEIPRTGCIWSVGSGTWSVKARIEKLIKKCSCQQEDE